DRIRREHEDIEKTLCGFCSVAPEHKTGILASGQPISLQPIDVRHYRLQISQRNGKVTVSLPGPLESGKQVNVSVEYHGKAAVVGRLGSGMLIQSHENRLVMANLSEPFGAPTWWP